MVTVIIINSAQQVTKLIRFSDCGVVSFFVRLQRIFQVMANIAIASTGQAATVVVHNTGQPVSKLDLPRLFDRFFRIQTSREGGSENHGLGLAIVAAIALMHGGQTLAACEGGITLIGFTISNIPCTGRVLS